MILVTGGAGYIGSHVCLELLIAGHTVAVLDNFANAHREALRRVERLAGRPLHFVEGDVRDRGAIASLLAAQPIDAVIHLAGLKSVAESQRDPLSYYDVNVTGAAHLLAAMAEAGIKRFLFSSSATVYGAPQALPLTESHPCAPVNPYGRTKLAVEDMLRDLILADPAWRIGILRYFNPVGAHISGQIGEDPLGVPNNLVPYLALVASGRLPHLTVFGDTYPTPDGTGIRDFVHVVDLAQAHLSALAALEGNDSFTLNIGTGRGHSVNEVIRAFETASGQRIPCKIGPPRDGDVAVCFADSSAAHHCLGWRATRGLDAMCVDHWRWQRDNPGGYSGRD